MRRVAGAVFVALLFVPTAAWPQEPPIGPEFGINTYTTGNQQSPSVGADSAGNFVVVWRSDGQDGSVRGVFGQRYAGTGAPLGPEFRVNTYTTSYQQFPSVAVAGSGSFVVAWESIQDGSFFSVFGQRYAASGAPLGPEFPVNTYTTDAQGLASVAVDSSGNFVVVWDSMLQDGSSDGIFGQRFASSGAPLGPEFRVNTYTTGSQLYPSVAADSSGNFVVVWGSDVEDGSGFGIFGQRYASSGAPLGPEFRVNTSTTGNQYLPVVASDPGGNFVVVWGGDLLDGSGVGVFGQRYAGAGGPLGPEFQVNTFTTGNQNRPSIAMDSSGNFVVVWRSDGEDGSSFGVFGQRYTAAGAAFGPEFQVNTYTTGAQNRPKVAAGTAGNFVVTWDSPQDGSIAGIFGQRYDPIVPVELMQFRVE